MSAGNDLFGFELILKTVEKDVKTKSDIIVILVHWFLTKNSNFRAIGTGDDRTISDADIKSELLPEEWNDSPEKYTIRYKLNNELFIFIATNSENIFIMNLLNTANNKVSNIALNPDDLVKSLKGTLQEMVPNYSEIISRIKKELIEPIVDGTSKETTTQTDTEKKDRNDLKVSPTLAGNPLYYPNPSFDRNPLRDIGRGDLLPGGIGGGMLFDPTRPNFGPRLPNVPGARFDPFAPPGIRNIPDNDHFRPPRGNNWDDNMFM